MRAAETRVDLLLHSRASTDTGSWFLSRALLPESYTDPAAAYAIAKRRGMDMVALTDHNTISGALEIAHHPDVIVGVEVTTSFPEDGCRSTSWPGAWTSRSGPTSIASGPTSTSWSPTWRRPACPTPWPTPCTASAGS